MLYLHLTYPSPRQFDETWRELCEWLDSSMSQLNKFLTPSASQQAMKSDIDELKVSATSLKFIYAWNVFSRARRLWKYMNPKLLEVSDVMMSVSD